MERVWQTLEVLFDRSADQRTVTRHCKEVNRYGPEERKLLTSEVISRLHHLLDLVPVHALSVRLQCEGSSVLVECLRPYWEKILHVCIDHLNENRPNYWNHEDFPLAVKVLYIYLKSCTTSVDQQVVEVRALEAAQISLTLALVTNRLESKHFSLITTTTLCLILQQLKLQNVKSAFLNTLWIVSCFSTDGEREKKCVKRETIKELYQRAESQNLGEDLLARKFTTVESSYSVTLLLYGLFNCRSEWLFSDGQEGEEVLLYALHPMLRKLCEGATYYSFQAFQVLHLWLCAVREFGVRVMESSTNLSREESLVLPRKPSHPSKEPLFAVQSNGSQADSVFHTLNANWESPVKGVNELVYCCMKELLGLHEDGAAGAGQCLAQGMLEALLSSSSAWTSKSTYPPLSLALTHLGSEKVLALYPTLPAGLLSSLGVNHLAPVGTSVYKVVLSQLSVDSWSQYFLAPICEGLLSQDRLRQQHLLSLWLPPTLRQYPGVHQLLLVGCSNTPEGWLARMAILRIARSVGALDLREERDEGARKNMALSNHIGQRGCKVSSISPYLQTALRHISEPVRLEALSLLCCTLKASQPVSPWEALWLKSFFVWNMNIDSAPFRQGIIKCFRTLVIRLRDASTSCLKTLAARKLKTKGQMPLECNKNPEFAGVFEEDQEAATVLETNACLLVWVVRLAHFNLAPEGNYQRRILALHLYKETLLAFYSSSRNSHPHHYSISQRYQPLMEYLNTTTFSNQDNFGGWEREYHPITNLTIPWTLEMLLYFALDEMNDVREEAGDILKILTDSRRVHLGVAEAREWMKRALQLCDSPKASDADAGGMLALRVAWLLPDLCHDLPEVMEIKCPAQETEETHLSKTLPLLNFFFSRVEDQFKAAQQNLLQAARHTPIHGSLQALGQCILHDTEVKTLTPQDLCSFMHKLSSLLQQLVEFMLDTLASTAHQGSVVAPSFAEMGEAVEEVIRKYGKAEEETTAPSSPLESREMMDNSPSSDHLLVLSCCWQTLKSCCEVCSMNIELFSHDHKELDGVVRGVVMRVLVGTRHKGAMEAARIAYSHICRALLDATSEGSSQLVHKQVSEVLESLCGGMQTSITRRAAGVAMMMQAACGAAPSTTPTLLNTTLTTLITIARTEHVDQETTDAPPVLALHILHSLVLHAPLAHFLRHHLPSITAICLQAFTSPSWALRNAALQLYGAVVPRMVGQKKVREDSSTLNSLTAPEFLSRHPALTNLLLIALEEGGNRDFSRNARPDNDEMPILPLSQVHTSSPKVHRSTLAETHMSEYYNAHATCTPSDSLPSIKKSSLLVPVLSLVARLSPGTGLQQSAGLVTTLDGFRDAVIKLLASPAHSVRRLAALALVSLTQDTQALSCVENILQDLKNATALTSTNLIHGKMLTVVSFLQSYPELAKNKNLRTCVDSSLSWFLGQGNKCHVTAALALKIMMCLNVMHTKADQPPAVPELSLPGAADHLLSLTHMVLLSDPEGGVENILLLEMPAGGDVLDLCREQVLELIKNSCSVSWLLNIENLIWHRLLDDTLPPKAVVVLLTFLITMLEGSKDNSTINPLPHQHMRKLLSLLEESHGSQAATTALVAVAHLLRKVPDRQWPGEGVRCDILSAFIRRVKHYSAPSSTQDYRMAASTALKINLKTLLFDHLNSDPTQQEQVIVACTLLLQDEDSVIRESACHFASVAVSSMLLANKEGSSKSESPDDTESPDNLFPSELIHPKLALLEFLKAVMKRSFALQDWLTMRALWRVCSGQAFEEFSLMQKELSAPRSYLFQSHTMNLYKEPKQLSIAVAMAMMETLRENTGTSLLSVPNWLQEEKELLNKQGEILSNLVIHQPDLYQHKLLLSSVSVYITACQTFGHLCDFFGVSVELFHLLTWEPSSYCTLVKYTMPAGK